MARVGNHSHNLPRRARDLGANHELLPNRIHAGKKFAGEALVYQHDRRGGRVVPL